MGDCHLGGWRHPKLKRLNFLSFQTAINKCIKEKVDFILIAGDLFDSPYPPIDILKNTFGEFRKLKEAKIPVFLIAGSHDYSVSGKTFLDVLEKAGFCKNAFQYEEKSGSIMLQPLIYKNFAIYGYPGKKSGLEIKDIEKIKLQDAPGFFKILMLHTAIRDAVPNLQINAVNEKTLPKVNYLALSHLHIKYVKENKVYSGPLFPNNIKELEELKSGSFFIVENGNIKEQEIKLKEIFTLSLEIKNALSATEEIISILERENLKDKIMILKLYGTLETGKSSDIDFVKIEKFLEKKEIYAFLKSTTKLHLSEPDFKINVLDSQDLENQLIDTFQENNPSEFNTIISDLIRVLQVEKLNDEKLSVFEDRLIGEIQKIIKI